jgi:putative ABC transport system permease protein
MSILSLARKSLTNRRSTAILTVVSIALSVMLLLGVERIRNESRTSFANTISGTDLVVGARSGAVQLLLYSVFRIGNATNNISWQSYQDVAALRQVAWTIPISLGDSYRGHPVVGTNGDYFAHYRYGRGQPLNFIQGEPFADVYDAVLGAEIARELDHELGDELVLAHGASKVTLLEHGDKPFRVVGILAPTGTPVDRTIHVTLEGIEAIHIDWQAGVPIPGLTVDADTTRKLDLSPKVITAFFMGLKSKISTFKVQRHINEYAAEPLLAVLPGVALQELWGLIGVAENALLIVSGFVVLVGLMGMLTVLLSSLNERRREMAVLRSIGARPLHIFALILGEITLLTLIGMFVGLLLLYTGLLVTQPLAAEHFGLYIEIAAPSLREIWLLTTVFVAGSLVGLIPAYRAYRYSLADGMMIRV